VERSRLAVVLAVVVATTTTGVAIAASSGAKVVADARGDTRSPDLDIVTAAVSSQGAAFGIQLRLAGEMRDDVIYSGMIDCSGKRWQLAARRVLGDNSFFLFSRDASLQFPASGSISGRTVTLLASARKMGCTAGIVRFVITAEGTNGRARARDRVPQRGTATFRA
jgi:hypothetical protein